MFYFGELDREKHSYGFCLDIDSRRDDTFIELTDEEHSKLITAQNEGKQIVCYDGKVFATDEIDRYYVDDNGEWQIRPKKDYEEEQKQKERERLDNLSMTRGDVFEALILAKGLGKAQIRAMIEQASLDDITKALYLNRFDEALEFYRGYPIFDMLGQVLGITGEMLDKFFETKDYHELITKEVVDENTTDTTTDIPNEVG